MQKRKPSRDDQKNADRAACLILALRTNYKEIDNAQWIGGLITILANTYKELNISYEDFCDSIDDIKEFYKYLWEE